MVSELLEESGVDREKVRLAKRQVLEGIMMLCRWQLERMAETDRAAQAAAPPRRRSRKITVE